MIFRASISCSIGRYGHTIDILSRDEFLRMREALCRASASAPANDGLFLNRLYICLFGRYDDVNRILSEYEIINH